MHADAAFVPHGHQWDHDAYRIVHLKLKAACTQGSQNCSDFAPSGWLNAASTIYWVLNQVWGRQLSSKLFGGEQTFQPLFQYLRTLKWNGDNLMLGEGIDSVDHLRLGLFQAEKELRLHDPKVHRNAFSQAWVMQKETHHCDRDQGCPLPRCEIELKFQVCCRFCDWIMESGHGWLSQ